jgi:hypothetical protein
MEAGGMAVRLDDDNRLLDDAVLRRSSLRAAGQPGIMSRAVRQKRTWARR